MILHRRHKRHDLIFIHRIQITEDFPHCESAIKKTQFLGGEELLQINKKSPSLLGMMTGLVRNQMFFLGERFEAVT
jgi:hypothetical protein